MSFLDILEHLPLFWASLIAQLVKNRLQCRRPWFNSWVGKIPWRRARLPTPVFLDFPCGSAGKESACNGGDMGVIPGLGRSPGEGNGYPLQYSGLENAMDYSPWSRKELYTSERLSLSLYFSPLFKMSEHCNQWKDGIELGQQSWKAEKGKVCGQWEECQINQ